MAVTANPSARPIENLSSPQSRRSRGWTEIVRGEPESVAIAIAIAGPGPSSTSPSPSMDVAATVPSPSVDSLLVSGGLATENLAESCDATGGSSNVGKKPAWSKPSNGAVEASLVMGAVSWPALSESAKANAKPQSAYSSKGPEEGSSAVQGSGVASSSSPSPSPSPSSYSRSQKQVASNPNSNNAYPARQRGSKRGGSGGGSAAQNSPSQALATPVSGMEGPLINYSSPKDHAHNKMGNWDSGQKEFQSHSSNNHPQQQQQRSSSFRKGNGGPHPRGDSSYPHNYGGRRDRDTERGGNHDWNPHQSYNGRDSHMHPRRAVPRPFVRPPPHASTFMTPPPVGPLGSPMGFELPSPLVYIPHEPFRGVPFFAPIPPPQAMIFPALDPQLHTTIVTQIDYYFSNENLIKDTYLRQNMDDQGWIPIKLIAGFNKVKKLTDNIQLILDAVRTSSLVEVQGDKVRRRNDWMRWLMPSVHFPTVPGSQSPGGPSPEMLASRVHTISLEQTSGVADVQGGSDNIVSSRNLNEK